MSEKEIKKILKEIKDKAEKNEEKFNAAIDNFKKGF